MANISSYLSTLRSTNDGKTIRNAIADITEAVNTDNNSVITLLSGLSPTAIAAAAVTATTKAGEAAGSADDAMDSQVVAAAQADISTTAAAEALASKNAAATSEANSKASELASDASEGVAITKANESAASAAAALASEQAAAEHESVALGYKDATIAAVGGATDLAEIIESRKGKATLGEKISEIDSQLADIGTEIDEVKEYLKSNRYGIKVNKLDSNPATRIEYIYDAENFSPAYMDYISGQFNYGSWADVWFVKYNYPVMLKYDGTEDYKLNPNDYGFNEDGVTASDVANTAYAGNAMAAMPLVWIKQYEVGDYEYVILCEQQYDETYKAYAHQRADGSIQDKIYLSMFKGSYDGTRLRSISGQQPMYSQAAAGEITRATANGTQWYTKTYSQRNLLQCLLTVMSKTDNGQTAYGNGNFNYNASLTPTMGVMVAGSLNANGQFMGYNDNTHQVKVFHQEAPWADQWDRLAGMLNVNGKIKVKMTRPYNLIGTDFIDTGLTPIGTTGGYIKNSKMTEYGRIPYNAAGSSSTYQPDGLWLDNAITAVALAGGSCNNNQQSGHWCVNLGNSAANVNWAFGASLSCELPAT